MTKIRTPDDLPTFEEMTQPGPESTDPDYLAWRDARVRETLAKMDSGEMKMHSLEDVKKRFGLDVR